MTVPAKRVGCFSETTFEDEVVVLHLESGEFYSLQGSARAIWEAIDGVASREALIAALAENFDAPPAEIAADVDRFLDRLSEAGLVAR
ncbi:MAG: HPr-rel-A system PqqD family peptide chaperone [Sphingomonadales bacterium]|nr:HPr-rel-A system PqqD family peptide chaperone [Sphingomonadales bacterium]